MRKPGRICHSKPCAEAGWAQIAFVEIDTRKFVIVALIEGTGPGNRKKISPRRGLFEMKINPSDPSFDGYMGKLMDRWVL